MKTTTPQIKTATRLMIITTPMRMIATTPIALMTATTIITPVTVPQSALETTTPSQRRTTTQREKEMSGESLQFARPPATRNQWPMTAFQLRTPFVTSSSRTFFVMTRPSKRDTAKLKTMESSTLDMPELGQTRVKML